MSGIDDRARRLSIGGALLAALTASSCCLGPCFWLRLASAERGSRALLARIDRTSWPQRLDSWRLDSTSPTEGRESAQRTLAAASAYAPAARAG
jgi:hypothetical protein